MANTVEYVLDVTGVPFFVPYKKGSGEWNLDLSKRIEAEERCPGILIGTVHREGYKKLLEWYKKNPDWEDDYFPKE
jgi:hypothetical protein